MESTQYRQAPSFIPVRILLTSLAALPLLLTGCGIGSSAAPEPLASLASNGHVFGGQQPVSGATVTVLSVGTSGYGVPGSILATTTTDDGGNYSFGPGAYVCPTVDTPILITARGGNPGLASGTNNTAIYLASFAGPCGLLTPTTRINVNEVTTVATAYVLRPFQSGNNIGTSSTNLAGVGAAYNTYKNLVDNTVGRAPGSAVPPGVNIPVARINALANSIAACVNSASVSSTICQNLFSYAGSASSGNTANSFAVLNAIMTNPANNVANIFNLAGAQAPFPATLSSPPADWTLPVIHTVGYLSGLSNYLDIDTNGNVWVGTKGGFGGTVEEISNTGVSIKTGLLNGVADNIDAVAVSPAGGALIGSYSTDDGNVAHITAAGVNDATNYAVKTATDVQYIGTTNAIVMEGGANPKLDSFTNAKKDDEALLPAGSTSMIYPGVGAQSFAYVGNADSKVYEYLYGNVGTFIPPIYAYNFYGSFTTPLVCNSFYAGPANLYCVGFDESFLQARLSVLTYSGTSVTSYLLPGLRNATMDGLGQLWATHVQTGVSQAARVYRLASPSTSGTYSYIGAADNTKTEYGDVKIDVSGNVWLTPQFGTGGLVELVGAAAPTFTPYAYNVINKTFGTRP